MMSTGTMIKTGKTYHESTFEVCARSPKLMARYRRMIRRVYGILQENGHVFKDRIHGPYPIGDSTFNILIERCGGNIKLACAVIVSGLPPDVATRHLDLVSGNFQRFVDSFWPIVTDQNPTYSDHSKDDPFLAIDGGGTKCAVFIVNRTEIPTRASARAGSLNSMPVDFLLGNIQSAVMKAVSLISEGSWP